jgi:hypothetical protein
MESDLGHHTSAPLSAELRGRRAALGLRDAEADPISDALVCPERMECLPVIAPIGARVTLERDSCDPARPQPLTELFAGTLGHPATAESVFSR